MNQSKKNVIWRGVFLELKCMLVLIIDLTTSQIPRFPKFTSKKQLCNWKIMDISYSIGLKWKFLKFIARILRVTNKKLYQLVSLNLQVHCQKICGIKKYITKGQEDPIYDKKILYHYKLKVPLILDHSWIILIFFSSQVPWLVSPCLKRTQHKQILICK